MIFYQQPAASVNGHFEVVRRLAQEMHEWIQAIMPSKKGLDLKTFVWILVDDNFAIKLPQKMATLKLWINTRVLLRAKFMA